MLKTKNIKDRITIEAGLISSVILFIIIMVFAVYSYMVLFNDLRSRLMVVANIAAAAIDGDKLTKLQNREDEKSSDYLKIKRTLQKIRDANNNIRYVYTMTKTDKKDILEFVVDAEEDPKLVSHIGDKFDISEYPEMQKSFKGPVADKTITKDEWGNWLSGYAPVYNSKAQVIGIIGLDMSVKELLYYITKTTYFAIVLLIAGTLFAVYWSRKFALNSTKPLESLIKHTEELGEGILDKKLELNTNDEYQILADSFNDMAIKLQKTQNELINEAQKAKNQKEQIFQIYRDVIFSVTQGKLMLISPLIKPAYSDYSNFIKSSKIEKPEDVHKARALVQEIWEKAHSKNKNLNQILLVVSEAVTNVIKHAKKGIIKVGLDPDKLIIIIQDEGPGMDFDKLPHMIFFKGFSTKQSLGCGFSMIYAFTDKINLCTSEQGTFLVLEFNLRKADNKETHYA